MHMDPAKRRHLVTCLSLSGSLCFAIASMININWVVVETGAVLHYIEFGLPLCCYSGAETFPPHQFWGFRLNSVAMFMALCIQGLYILYLIFTLGRGNCPAHMVRTDLSISSFLSFLYILVIISWPWVSLDYYRYYFHDAWPGLGYYYACIAGAFALSSAGSSSFYVKTQGGWYY